jgi:hypothetical protein
MKPPSITGMAADSTSTGQRSPRLTRFPHQESLRPVLTRRIPMYSKKQAQRFPEREPVEVRIGMDVRYFLVKASARNRSSDSTSRGSATVSAIS